MKIGNRGKKQINEQLGYEYRKIHPILNGASISVVLPKNMAVNIGLRKDGFARINQEGDKLVIVKA